jgi:thioredoxin 1
MLANAITVTDATFEQEIEQSKGLTLVDFSATWCAPCRLIEPILDEIALARRGELKVATVDTDENIRTTARFQVRSAPTILFFKDGQLVDRIVGAVPRARIEAVIVKHA